MAIYENVNGVIKTLAESGGGLSKVATGLISSNATNLDVGFTITYCIFAMCDGSNGSQSYINWGRENQVCINSGLLCVSGSHYTRVNITNGKINTTQATGTYASHGTIRYIAFGY